MGTHMGNQCVFFRKVKKQLVQNTLNKTAARTQTTSISVSDVSDS